MPPKPSYASGSDYHLARRKYTPSTIRCLELAIELLGPPGSLLDVGCGEGHLIEWSRQHGIEAIGVDMAVADDLRGWFYYHNLELGLDLGVGFDWVLCWEVAEHLNPEAADTLCDTLALHVNKPSGRLLFTAAGLGQRGPGHVHLQSGRYWLEMMRLRGLRCLVADTTRVRHLWETEVPKAPWYGRNALVFAWA